MGFVMYEVFRGKVDFVIREVFTGICVPVFVL